RRSPGACPSCLLVVACAEQVATALPHRVTERGDREIRDSGRACEAGGRAWNRRKWCEAKCLRQNSYRALSASDLKSTTYKIGLLGPPAPVRRRSLAAAGAGGGLA